MYSKHAFGLIGTCNQCGSPLEMKTFSNWKIGAGIGIITTGIVLVVLIPWVIIWIGAFIWGGRWLYSGYKQWALIRTLDNDFLNALKDYSDRTSAEESRERTLDTSMTSSDSEFAEIEDNDNKV